MKKLMSLVLSLILLISSIPVIYASAEDAKIPRKAVEFNGHSYVVYSVATVTSWNAAKTYCEDLGGHLAVISSGEENTFLTEYINSKGYTVAYFGFSDTESEGTWKWVADEKSTYTNWSSDQPDNSSDEDYAQIWRTDGTWNDDKFSGQNAFICEWDELRQQEPEPDIDTFIKIYTIEDLYSIRYALDDNYILMADIDMTKDTAPGGDWDNGYGWAPIGEDSTMPFTGIFDGNGHTIKGMQITGIRTAYAGLFGCVNGRIRNLTMDTVTISTYDNNTYVGGLVGSVEGVIENVTMKNVTITSGSNTIYVGGLAAFAQYSHIKDIVVDGTISHISDVKKSYTGGLVGELTNASILSNCTNSIIISNKNSYKNQVKWYNQYGGGSGWNVFFGYSYCGGICGKLSIGSQINNSYNTSKIASETSGSYSISYCDGSYSYTGGIIGYSSDSSLTMSCYNKGEIISNSYKGPYSGGISSTGNVIGCINLGAITSEGGEKSAISNGTITNCYYLRGTADFGKHNTTDTATTAVALSAAQMKLKAVFGLLDFENVWFLDTSKGINHPQLIANPESEYEHTHDYKTEVIAPTCTEKGYTSHTCTVCGDNYKDTYVDALGHNFGDWKVTKPASCTEKGEKTRYCSRCDAFETREVKASDHSYKDVVTAPTCTEKGYTTHTCSACQDSYVDTYVNALGHDYKAVVTKPTCTEQGYTTYTCSRCNDSYKADYVPAKGHTDGEWKVTKQPTLTSEGTKTLYCSVCGKVIRTESIPKLTQGRVYSVKVDDISLNYKKSTTLKPGIEADNGVKYTVKYESSNPKVATVDQNGNVTATKRGSGSATITCTVTDQYGNVVKDTCKVNVSLTFGQKIIVYVLFGWIWY